MLPVMIVLLEFSVFLVVCIALLIMATNFSRSGGRWPKLGPRQGTAR